MPRSAIVTPVIVSVSPVAPATGAPKWVQEYCRFEPVAPTWSVASLPRQTWMLWRGCVIATGSQSGRGRGLSASARASKRVLFMVEALSKITPSNGQLRQTPGNGARPASGESSQSLRTPPGAGPFREPMAQPTTSSLDTLAIDTIRTLSMDVVQKANSGHPGTPMALAPVIYTLWQEELRYDPEQPNWPDRDRFVLSCGHASMLLYSTLFLAGVKELDKNGRKTGKLAVTLEELQRFRQLDSKTPGHPEFGHTTGVETTTGPLGQGVANSVGMAIAQRWLAARYNQPGFELVRHRVWALCGDGDLMEGISSEAASIAGHLGLSNLCWIYDSNRITIE